MDETKQLLDRLHKDNEELRADLKKEGRSRRRFLAGGIVVVLIIGYALYRNREFRSCLIVWAGDVTDRSNSLSGPAGERVNLFFQAYTEAAGGNAKLTAKQRVIVIDGLDEARAEYTVIPSHAALEKQTDAQLLSERDLVGALRANGVYQHQQTKHPVPTAPTCGGLL